MLKFGQEERYSYLQSIDNLITLKILHDYGVDVSTFPDFMIDIGFNSDGSMGILKEGLESLFDTLVEYNPYHYDANEYTKDEDEEALKDTLEEIGFDIEGLHAEFYFICSSVKIRRIFEKPVYKQKILSLFESVENEYKFLCSIDEGDIQINKDNGLIGMSFEYFADGSEFFENIISFLKIVDRIYKESEGEK